MNTKTTRITPQQVDAQLAVCQKIHAYWAEQGVTPKAYVETYGCQPYTCRLVLYYCWSVYG